MRCKFENQVGRKVKCWWSKRRRRQKENIKSLVSVGLLHILHWTHVNNPMNWKIKFFTVDFYCSAGAVFLLLLLLSVDKFTTMKKREGYNICISYTYIHIHYVNMYHLLYQILRVINMNLLTNFPYQPTNLTSQYFTSLSCHFIILLYNDDADDDHHNDKPKGFCPHSLSFFLCIITVFQ